MKGQKSNLGPPGLSWYTELPSPCREMPAF